MCNATHHFFFRLLPSRGGSFWLWFRVFSFVARPGAWEHWWATGVVWLLWRVERSSKQGSSSKRVPGSLSQRGLRCLEERVLRAAWRAGVGGAGDEVGEGQGLHGAEGAQGILGKSGSSRGAAGLLAAMELQWLGQWGWCCTGRMVAS